MESARLRSYDFKCPCCSEPHRRKFEYFAKFMGAIPEDQELPTDREVSMIEMAQMKDQTVFENSRSLPVGNSTFRCGKCHEFFQFADTDFSPPVLLSGKERENAMKNFKPITVVKRNAVMNSLGSLVGLLNQYGCVYDENDKTIVITDKAGKEYRLPIAEQLFDAFYKDNPMFDVKKHEKWAFDTFENEAAQKQA